MRLIGAATALWALLPRGLVGFTSFVPLFAAATALGALSHVPGGLGVFELVVLWALKGHAPPETVAAALVAYRAIYFILPLTLFLIFLLLFALYSNFKFPFITVRGVLLSAPVGGIVALFVGFLMATRYR